MAGRQTASLTGAAFDLASTGFLLARSFQSRGFTGRGGIFRHLFPLLSTGQFSTFLYLLACLCFLHHLLLFDRRRHAIIGILKQLRSILMQDVIRIASKRQHAIDDAVVAFWSLSGSRKSSLSIAAGLINERDLHVSFSRAGGTSPIPPAMWLFLGELDIDIK